MSKPAPAFTKRITPQFSSREMRDDYYRAIYAKKHGVDLGGGGATAQPEDSISMDIPWSLSKLVIGTVLLFKFIDRLAKLLWHAFAFVMLITILIMLAGIILA